MPHHATSALSNWYMIDADDVITAVGPSWDQLALENNAANAVSDKVIGRSVWAFLDCEETRDFLKTILQYCRRNRRALEWSYKFDSDWMARVAMMRVDFQGADKIRIVHDVVSEKPRAPVALHPCCEVQKQCTQCLTRYDMNKLRAVCDWQGYPTVYGDTFVCEDCRNHVEMAMQ